MTVAINADAANIPAVNFVEQGSHPSAPGSGHALIYVKDGIVYVRLDAGDPVAVGGVPSLAEGQLAIGDASDQLTALALGTEGQAIIADANGMATWDDLPEGGGSGTETYRQEIFPGAYSAYTGGAPTPVAATGQLTGIIWQPASPANADEMEWIVDLSAGTWTFRVIWFRYTNRGIGDLYLDSTEIGSQDQYGNQLANNVWTITGVSVATGGLHTVKLKADGKHASSSGYAVGVSWITAWRTA